MLTEPYPWGLPSQYFDQDAYLEFTRGGGGGEVTFQGDYDFCPCFLSVDKTS